MGRVRRPLESAVVRQGASKARWLAAVLLIAAGAALLLSTGAFALPDLQVSLADPPASVDGQFARINVTLTNAGDAAGASPVVVLSIDGTPFDPPLAFPTLGPGQSASMEQSAVLTCGVHTVLAAADPSNTTAESDETNNNASRTARTDPFADFTSSLSGSPGAMELALNASSSHGCEPLTFTWQVDPGVQLSGVNVTFTAPAGNLTVNLTVASTANATLRTTVSRVVVVPNAAPAVSASLPSSEILTDADLGLEVIADDPDGGVVSVFIDLGDGNSTSSVSDASSHRYPQPGDYTVAVRVTDNLGATNETTVVVHVLNRPPTARTDLPYVYAVAGQTVRLDGSPSSDPEGGPLTYHWDLGDGTTSTAPNISHAYAAPAVYRIKLNVSDSYGASNELTVVVNIQPGSSGGTGGAGTWLTASLLAFIAVLTLAYAVRARARAAGPLEKPERKPASEPEKPEGKPSEVKPPEMKSAKAAEEPPKGP